MKSLRSGGTLVELYPMVPLGTQFDLQPFWRQVGSPACWAAMGWLLCCLPNSAWCKLCRLWPLVTDPSTCVNPVNSNCETPLLSFACHQCPRPTHHSAGAAVPARRLRNQRV